MNSRKGWFTERGDFILNFPTQRSWASKESPEKAWLPPVQERNRLNAFRFCSTGRNIRQVRDPMTPVRDAELLEREALVSGEGPHDAGRVPPWRDAVTSAEGRRDVGRGTP